MLLDESQDTMCVIYNESHEKIEQYYESEEKKIRLTSERNYAQHMLDMAEAFKVSIYCCRLSLLLVNSFNSFSPCLFYCVSL